MKRNKVDARELRETCQRMNDAWPALAEAATGAAEQLRGFNRQYRKRFPVFTQWRPRTW